MTETALIPIERIQGRILLIRNQKVLLDVDLAQLYGVTTFNLNKAVARNKDRFPPDFMFQLSDQEFRALKFQFGIANQTGRGGRRTAPYAFTEQGVAMLSSVLRSKTAVLVNVQIMRSFAKLREMLQSNEALNRRLLALEQRVDSQGKKILSIISALESPKPVPRKRQIGFGRE